MLIFHIFEIRTTQEANVTIQIDKTNFDELTSTTITVDLRMRVSFLYPRVYLPLTYGDASNETCTQFSVLRNKVMEQKELLKRMITRWRLFVQFHKEHSYENIGLVGQYLSVLGKHDYGKRCNSNFCQSKHIRRAKTILTFGNLFVTLYYRAHAHAHARACVYIFSSK